MFGSAGIGAALVVLSLLSGRWSLSRVSGVDLGAFGEPRLYLAVLLLLLSLTPGHTPRTTPAVRRAIAWATGIATAFFGYMALTSLWAPDGADPIKAFEVGLMWVVVITSISLARAVGADVFMALLWKWLILLLALFAVLGVLAAASGTGRLAVLGGGPNVFGRNMGLLTLAVLALAIRGEQKAWALAAAVVAGGLVVLSGSRGALVATGAGVAVLLYLNSGRIGRIIYIGVVVLAIGALVVEFTGFGAEAADMFRERVLRLAVHDRYDSGRTLVYGSAWGLSMSAPLLGIGLNGFPVLGNHVYPHNLMLEVLCEGGLLGLTLALSLLWRPLAVIAARKQGPKPRDAAAFVLLLMAAQFSGDLYDSRGVFIFAGLVTVLGALDRSLPDGRRVRGRGHK